ncbi:multiple myeloma tumor-associated protein 2 homolog [Nephila pilipes]|uniref:Multiple myeloma tumor-associated protein 2 homolog n=1 Tax=Nephila pilipes TaxID=299642 RepID=A0A8X6U5H1_NEPPI|nr:multiple myeloma tumor-associated protein 2 homolog [Nephila pilipes]
MKQKRLFSRWIFKSRFVTLDFFLMYNPSRGGVRGGADQFTWESVKTDKHRENYLGHSLKAPVGRSLKGKDITWYAKERKDVEDTKPTDKSELAAIKRAEQEAMLIALGHKIVRKESQALTKEEMTEALKRNVGNRDDMNIERVGGVGARSKVAHLTGTRNKNEGVVFETRRERVAVDDDYKEQSPSSKKTKAKKSKKHKKEKKKSRNRSDSEDLVDDSNINKKHKSERTEKYNMSDSEPESTSKHKKDKKLKRENFNYFDDSNSNKRYREKSSHKDRVRNDSSESDNHSSTRKKDKRYHDSNNFNPSKIKHKKKSKHRHRNSSDSEKDSHRTDNKRYKTQENDVYPKRCRHDTSESD